MFFFFVEGGWVGERGVRLSTYHRQGRTSGVLQMQTLLGLPLGCVETWLLGPSCVPREEAGRGGRVFFFLRSGGGLPAGGG